MPEYIVEPDKKTPQGAFILHLQDDGTYVRVAQFFDLAEANRIATYANEGRKHIST